MKNKESARYRPKVVPLARGEVVEVGVGSGLNLPLYSREVRSVSGVDPSEELLRMARKRAASAPVPVQLLNSSAEALPFENEAADTHSDDLDLVLHTGTRKSAGRDAAGVKARRRTAVHRTWGRSRSDD